MRRKGSTARLQDWSPMVEAPDCSGPMASLRMRPRGWSPCRSRPPASGAAAWRRALLGTPGPGVVGRDHGLDVGLPERPSSAERQRARLARMAPMRTRKAVDRRFQRCRTAPWPGILLVSAPTPSSRTAVAPGPCRSRDQRGRQRHAAVKLAISRRFAPMQASDLAVDFGDIRLRVVQRRAFTSAFSVPNCVR